MTFVVDGFLSVERTGSIIDLVSDPVPAVVPQAGTVFRLLVSNDHMRSVSRPCIVDIALAVSKRQTLYHLYARK